MSKRTLLIVGTLVSLAVVTLAVMFSSAQPDGLEFVAEESGIAEQAQDSAVAGSPLADYGATGLDAISGGLVAGVVGGLVTALLLAAIYGGLRLRRPAAQV